MKEKKKLKNKTKITTAIISIFACIVVLVSGSFVYLASSSYSATNEIFIGNNTCYTTKSRVDVKLLENNNIEFLPNGEIKAGLVFYPGGNVDYTSYAPLLESLAENGIMSVLVKMPFDLAVFNSNGADGIKEGYPDIEKWYIGGHSLGGAMAGSYVEKHPDEFDGIILLAAYTTADISELDIKSISIYGSNDGVMNREKYVQCKENLPKNSNELVINGGCHSYFGDYGMQKKDGTPYISREEQINFSVEYIMAVM